MFPNYQQAGTTPAQPDIANALGQQRPGQQPQAPQQTGGQAQLTPGSSTSHHQMLQQALQQNPHLAAQIQQRLQPANVQVVFQHQQGPAHRIAIAFLFWFNRCAGHCHMASVGAWSWSAGISTVQPATAAADDAAATTAGNFDC